MIELSIDLDIGDTKQYLGKVQKQVPFAIAKSLSKTAQDIQKEEVREIYKVFDRPTRLTQKSVFMTYAKPHNFMATVYLREEAFKGNAPVKYLKNQIRGGGRAQKGFEKQLISRGQMPSGMYAVPSRTMKLNRFGNVTRGMHTKILSGLRGHSNVGFNANATPGSKTYGKYFSGIISGTHGIWDVDKLRRGLPALMFIFVSKPSYKKRFKFYSVAERTAKRMFSVRFNHEMKRALITAK